MIVVENWATQNHFSKVSIYNFLGLKNMKKGHIEMTKRICLETFVKCPGKLHFPILIEIHLHIITEPILDLSLSEKRPFWHRVSDRNDAQYMKLECLNKHRGSESFCCHMQHDLYLITLSWKYASGGVNWSCLFKNIYWTYLSDFDDGAGWTSIHVVFLRKLFFLRKHQFF